MCGIFSESDWVEEIEKTDTTFHRNYFPVYPQYITCDARLWSFDNWPKFQNNDPRILAEAGFYHTQKSDQVCCFYCGIVLDDWKISDCPWSEHLYWSPCCGYLLSVKPSSYNLKIFSACHKDICSK